MFVFNGEFCIYWYKGEGEGEGQGEGEGEGEAAIDLFLGPCYWSLLGVVCDVTSDAAAEEEEAIGWMFPSAQEGIHTPHLHTEC